MRLKEQVCGHPESCGVVGREGLRTKNPPLHRESRVAMTAYRTEKLTCRTSNNSRSEAVVAAVKPKKRKRKKKGGYEGGEWKEGRCRKALRRRSGTHSCCESLGK